MSITRVFLLLSAIALVSKSQQCLNLNGERVDWWAMLLFPDSVSTGFAYFDSTFSTATFQVILDQPDTAGTPLRRTLTQVLSQRMSYMAWNDDPPGTSGASSYKAHSKTVVALDESTNTGFLFDHSIPNYPQIQDDRIIIAIPTGQQTYGQHALCVSVVGDQIQEMIPNMLRMRPNFYKTGLISSFSDAEIDQIQDTSELFFASITQIGQFSLHSIFKNGKGSLNASILEDGLNNFLESPLKCETWVRNQRNQTTDEVILNTDPWCGQYSVESASYVGIPIDDGSGWTNLQWKYTKDHSKWCVAVDKGFGCFGDMNRMKSQWDRGGAYYCIQSDLLKEAMNKLIINTFSCPA